MPRGNEHILFSIYERLAGHFVLKLKTNYKIFMGKKIVVPC